MVRALVTPNCLFIEYLFDRYCYTNKFLEIGLPIEKKDIRE